MKEGYTIPANEFGGGRTGSLSPSAIPLCCVAVIETATKDDFRAWLLLRGKIWHEWRHVLPPSRLACSAFSSRDPGKGQLWEQESKDAEPRGTEIVWLWFLTLQFAAMVGRGCWHCSMQQLMQHATSYATLCDIEFIIHRGIIYKYRGIESCKRKRTTPKYSRLPEIYPSIYSPWRSKTFLFMSR